MSVRAEAGVGAGAGVGAVPRADLGRALGRSHYEGFRATLKAIGTGPRGSRDLTFEEARGALAALLAGSVTGAQAGAFLVAMRIKGESADELAGFASALRAATTRVSVDTARPLVACAGSYDGAVDAPHLALAAAVVAAACGAGIVLHCGSELAPKWGVTAAAVLAALGGPGRPTLAQSAAMLERAGVSVVHAGEAVAGWDGLLAVRDQVGLRGPVHSAEKLVDHFGARRFVVGYAHAHYGDRLLEALRALGAERAVAVRGIEGSEIPRPGRPAAHDRDRELELAALPGVTLRGGGGARASAELTTALLFGADADGELDDERLRAARQAVLLGAAVSLYASGLAPRAQDGFAMAAAALADGRAAATLAAMLRQ